MLSSINNSIQNDEKFMEILFKILRKKNNYPNGYNIDNAKDYLNKLTKNLIKEYDGNIGVNIYTDLLGKNIKKIEVYHEEYDGKMRAKLGEMRKLAPVEAEDDEDFEEEDFDEEDDEEVEEKPVKKSKTASKTKKKEEAEEEDDEDEKPAKKAKKSSSTKAKPKKKPEPEDDDDDWEDDDDEWEN